MDNLKSFSRIIEYIGEKIALIASFLALLMMVVIVYEVSSRYFANRPTVWSMELCQFAFAYIIALGAAYTLRTGGHVSVDILYNRLGKRTQSIISIFTNFIVIVFLIIFAYQTGGMALDALTGNEHSGTAFNPPTFPGKVIIPIGVIVLILQAAVILIRNVVQTVTLKDQTEESVNLNRKGRKQ